MRRLDLDIEDIARLYIEDGLSAEKIAKKYNCSQPTILSRLADHGIKTRPKAVRHDISTDEIARLYLEARWSTPKIASHFRCANRTVVDRLISVGVKLRPVRDTILESWKDPLTRQRRIEAYRKCQTGKHLSESARLKISGPNNKNWLGGISFHPYCPQFNDRRKEKTREQFGRHCFICNRSEQENGKKLDVHHCDYNKGQGCGQAWSLIPLCHSCHIRTNGKRWYWFNLLIHYWARNYMSFDSACWWPDDPRH